ncbi:hypothetical protein niasHT_030423 [Heterodera trifolii]|uniref:Uncharacterized protein n=1 Tax=Heterodera trifolii TaxID=157864 RepID=A0ABD2IB20_9BILA
MKRIKLCADVCYDVLAFFGPIMLGLKIALVSGQFNAVADHLLRRKKWTVGHNQIRRSKKGIVWLLEIVKDYQDAQKAVTFPFALSPPPLGITDFKSIQIKYVNHGVIAFLRHFQPVFCRHKIRFRCNIEETKHRSWELLMSELWPMVANNIVELHLYGIGQGLTAKSAAIQRHFTPALLLNGCANVHSICSSLSFPEAVPFAEAADAEPTNLSQALFKWLHIPSGDGRSKKLFYNASYGDLSEPESVKKGLEEFKKYFINAKRSVSYVLTISQFLGENATFVLDNGRTRERLSFSSNHLGSRYFLKRCPIEWDEKRRADLETEVVGMVDNFSSMDHRIDVYLCQNKNNEHEPTEPYFWNPPNCQCLGCWRTKVGWIGP